MGLIEPIAIASVMPCGILPVASAVMLWVPLVSALGVAAAGIWLAVPRRQRPLRRLTLVRSAATS